MQFYKATFHALFTSLILLASSGFQFVALGASSETYNQGNAAYEEGKFDQSVPLYLKCIQEGQISEELYYNLGNAYFKLENYGEAALWYRRALILNPRMPEPRQNLRALKNRVGMLDFEPKGIDLTISHFRENEIISILTGSIWLFLLCVAAILFIKRLRPWRSMLIIAGCLFASLIAVSFYSMKIFRNRIAIDHRAVVTVSDAIAQTSPVPDSKTVTELPPGSEIRIVTDSGPWQYIDIPGDLRGWVRADAISPLWPPNSDS